MKVKMILIFPLVLLMLVSCLGGSNKKIIVEGNIENTDSSEKKIAKKDEFVSRRNIVFYPIHSDTIYTYQTFTIIESKLILDCMDMDYYLFHISEINFRGDSIIEYSVDKQGDLDTYLDRGELILFDNTYTYKSKAKMVQNSNTHIWSVFFNNTKEADKYFLVDSLDIKKSGYAVDTTNYWIY